MKMDKLFKKTHQPIFGGCPLIIAALLLGAIIFTYSHIKLALELHEISIDINNNVNNFTFQIIKHRKPLIPSNLNITNILILCFIALCSFAYVIGIAHESPRLIEPLLFTTFGKIWIDFISGASNIMNKADSPNPLNLWISEIGYNLISPALQFFFWIVIYRYYKALIDDNKILDKQRRS